MKNTHCAACGGKLLLSFGFHGKTNENWLVYCSQGKCGSVVSNKGIHFNGSFEDSIKAAEKLNSLIEREIDFVKFTTDHSGSGRADAFRQFLHELLD